MKIKTLASGSKGNCSIVLCGNTKLLIDMGISYLQLKKNLSDLSLKISDFAGLLITHAHSDHIKGLSTLTKNEQIKIFIPRQMETELQDKIGNCEVVFIEDCFTINDVQIELIHTSHDAFSVGYIIEYDGKSLVYVTDTGYINRKYLEKMKSKEIYLLESNHDEKMLMEGPYPYYLKQRVLSDKGHLSNHTTAKYLEKLIGKNTKYVILAHLSEKNNTEEIAYSTVSEKLQGTEVDIVIARQNEVSPFIEV